MTGKETLRRSVGFWLKEELKGLLGGLFFMCVAKIMLAENLAESRGVVFLSDDTVKVGNTT